MTADPHEDRIVADLPFGDLRLDGEARLDRGERVGHPDHEPVTQLLHHASAPGQDLAHQPDLLLEQVDRGVVAALRVVASEVDDVGEQHRTRAVGRGDHVRSGGR